MSHYHNNVYFLDTVKKQHPAWSTDIIYKLKCSDKYPKQYLLSESPRKQMGSHREREKISDPGGIRTHDLRDRSLVLPPICA